MIQFDGHSATVSSLAFSPDSMLLASGAKDGWVRLWDAAGAMVQESNPATRQSRPALAWSPSGEWLVTTDGPRLVLENRKAKRPLEQTIPLNAGPLSTLAFVSDSLLAVGGDIAGAGQLVLWDVVMSARRPVPQPITAVHGIRVMIAYPGTKTLHWCYPVNASKVCRLRSWKVTSSSPSDANLGKPANAIAVSPDGSAVAIATDWSVKVFEANGKWSAELTGHKGQVAGVGFIHGGRTVVSASWDETVRFWDVATKKETARFPVGVGKLTALAVSPDGTRIAAGGTDGPISLLDAE